MTDTWTWATVTQASPLRIKVDGDTTALDATTGDLVGSLAVSDRVRVHLHSDGIIVTGIQGGGNRSNPNLLINSNFMVNQRGYVSGTDLALNAYGFDRWKASTATSRMTFTTAPQGQQVTIASGDSFAQLIERANVPAGTYTLSWQGTTSGLAVNDGGGASSALSPITVTLDGSANVRVQFAPGTLSNVKLERGPTATPYQPPIYADALRACMRYYYNPLLDITNGDANIAQGTADSTTHARIILPLPVHMRATPTLVTSGAFGLYNGSTVALTNMSLSGWTTRAVPVLYVTVASGLTANRAYLLKRNASASAALAFDARL